MAREEMVKLSAKAVSGWDCCGYVVVRVGVIEWVGDEETLV